MEREGIMTAPGRSERRWMFGLTALAVLAIAVLILARLLESRPSARPESTDEAIAFADRPRSPAAGLERLDPGLEAVRFAEARPVHSLAVPEEAGSTRPTHVAEPLRGRVVDDLGAPVSTFAILASRLTDRKPAALDPTSEAWKLFQDTDGTFALEDLAPGEWRLTARRPVSIRSSAVAASVPPSGSDLVLVIPRPAAIAGIVVDEAGNPIPKASIYLWNPGESEPDFMEEGNTSKETTRADDGGRFQLEDIQAGSPRVLARHPEFGDSDGTTLEIEPGQRKEDVRLTLKRGGRVEGTVAASVGPVEGRRIALYGFRGLSGWRETRTDDAGRFAIEGVLAQDYVVQLHPPDRPGDAQDHGVEDARSIRKTISVRNGETTRVVFDDPESRISIHGTVSAGGVPLSGCRLTVSLSDRGRMGGIDRPGRTDSEGRFSLAVEGPGNYLFMVEEKPASYALFERAVPDMRDVEESFEVPGGRILGRVVGNDGRALARVPVTILRTDGNDSEKPWRSLRRTATGPDGTFEFGSLEEGTYDVRAPDGDQGNDYATPIRFGRVVLQGRHVDVGEPAVSIELRLAPEGWISGQVLDTKGHGVANVSIQIRTESGVRLSAFPRESSTDATGCFLVSNVASGTYVVVAKRYGANGTNSESGPVVVESGRATTTRIELR
jgi:protocatechuate 3,4-dioxygenase beta subunit